MIARVVNVCVSAPTVIQAGFNYQVAGKFRVGRVACRVRG